MPYRLVGHADDRIDAILIETARRRGIPAAARYHPLILAAAAAAGEAPELPRSREIQRLSGVRVLHLRLMRQLVAPEDYVANPRHMIVHRIAEDRVVDNERGDDGS
ncbi:hypothetical protein [Lichenicoccus sp.]|uniref:hypothetical protein n=1 Tax=Lichenicoccus sp. TaxID=2781899 RepID=UPI003D0D4DE6